MCSHSTRLATSFFSAMTLIVLNSVSGIAQPTSLTKDFVPPVDDSPCCLSGGGTRGPERSVVGEPLTALIPQGNAEQTTEAYPTLLFYLPQHQEATPGLTAEFILFNEDHQVAYQTSVPVSGDAGILRVNLASANAPLEIGKSYTWVFSLVYNPTERETDVFVQGSIQRVEPASDLAQQLALAAPGDRPTLYAQAGFWYEALALMADLREQNPTNAALNTQWSSLLAAAGLQSFSHQPLFASDVSVASPQEQIQ